MSEQLYDTWRHMVARCRDSSCPEWKHYGSRGIGVWEPWAADYQTFKDYVLEALGPRPEGMTLDRVDNDKGYEPGNLRWATRSQNNRNRRNNRLITAFGRTQTLAAWSEEFGLEPMTIATRLKLGWDPELAVKEPLVIRRKPKPKS